MKAITDGDVDRDWRARRGESCSYVGDDTRKLLRIRCLRLSRRYPLCPGGDARCRCKEVKIEPRHVVPAYLFKLDFQTFKLYSSSAEQHCQPNASMTPRASARCTKCSGLMARRLKSLSTGRWRACKGAFPLLSQQLCLCNNERATDVPQVRNEQDYRRKSLGHASL